MSERDRVKDALEAKRKRLEDLRRAKSGGPPVVEQPAVVAVEAKADRESVDELVNSLLKSEPASVAAATPSPQSQPTSATAPATTASTSRTLTLMDNDVELLNIAPRSVEKFAKETQTREAAAPSTPAKPSGPVKEAAAPATPKIAALAAREEEAPVQIVELSVAERKEIESTQEYTEFFKRSTQLVERALSTGFDIGIDYSQYSDDEGDGGARERVRKHQTYYDEHHCKHRAVTSIAYSPKHDDLMAVSYVTRSEPSADSGIVCVWSTNVPARPEFTLECQSPVLSVLFNQYSPWLIVGGTYSGQIVVWDIRDRQLPVQRTPSTSEGHAHPVYSAIITGTTNAHSLVTASTDGRVCVWSMDRLHAPVESFQVLSRAKNRDISITTMAFAQEEVNTFFVGSEDGGIYQASRSDGKSKEVDVKDRFEGHHGPITSLSFHPSGGSIDHSDLFLSSSFDWSCKLWSGKPGAARPLYSFEDASDYVLDVQWSPVHPALFAASDASGSVSVWNINENMEEPVHKTEPSTRAMVRCTWSRDGRHISAGDSAGHVTLFDVASDTAAPRADESARLDRKLRDVVSTA
eukprot:TRINITY_DN13323_c0_g1_i1.p1 TRINITY_DN13323_c0_g1~~TRINITY_DN13323_c0_g1_i1.p1  ORF type:complete len:579 (+),score=119.82 TRINITY_DN13323_c0_g1_i1:41-1777(+)